MKKLYLLGGLSCIGGLIMMLYQTISSLMTVGEIVWKRVTLMDIIDAKYLVLADSVSLASISGIMNYVLTMPLAYLLLGLGVLFFIIGGITDK